MYGRGHHFILHIGRCVSTSSVDDVTYVSGILGKCYNFVSRDSYVGVTKHWVGVGFKRDNGIVHEEQELCAY